MIWTPEREARALYLFKQGNTLAEIAAYFGGVSRSAVSGKLYRLGCQRGPRSKKKRQLPRARFLSRQTPNPKFVEAAPPTVDPAFEPAPLYVELLELRDNHCRWPIGNGPFTFCGHPPRNHSSYCPHHHQRTRA